MKIVTDFVLASQSPRRKQLLEQLGLSFRVVPSYIDETILSPATPADIVQQLALKKARSVSRRWPTALTVGADTIVVHDGDILGKPRDTDHACKMLRRLSGSTHTVFTGLALLHPATNRQSVAYEATHVTFAPLSGREIDAYVATGSSMDKAGAYGIQDDLGSAFVTRIDGDFFCVVGLPLHRLYQMLRDDFSNLVVL